MGQGISDKLFKFSLLTTCLVFEYDKGMGGFSPLFMGHPNHGNFLDSRVA
jgi:hypothetical protein